MNEQMIPYEERMVHVRFEDPESRQAFEASAVVGRS